MGGESIEARTAESSESVPQVMEKAPLQPKPHRHVLRVAMTLLVLALPCMKLVPLRDILFTIFASAYFFLFAKYVFPNPTNELPASPLPPTPWLGRYISVAGLVAIPAPMLFMLASFLKGEKASVLAAAPHLFLIASQVLSEIVVVTWRSPLSLPVRAMVPIFYNTRRLFTVAGWLDAEFSGAGSGGVFSVVGRGLAVVNMALWAFNLFCFLLPVYLPLCMRRHSEIERASKEHQA